MKTLIALTVISLTAGCVASPYAYITPPMVVAPPVAVEVAYEPEVVIGLYPLGFYNPSFGYWTGAGWDANFYVVGHPGYGHYYQGAPPVAFEQYRSGGFYHGGAAVGMAGGIHANVAVSARAAPAPSWGARFSSAVTTAGAKMQANAVAPGRPNGGGRVVNDNSKSKH